MSPLQTVEREGACSEEAKQLIKLKYTNPSIIQRQKKRAFIASVLGHTKTKEFLTADMETLKKHNSIFFKGNKNPERDAMTLTVCEHESIKCKN